MVPQTRHSAWMRLTNLPPLNTYVGASVSFPLRIFDRNQGDKLQTLLDIGRNEKLRDAAEVAALHDVDSAYATLESTLKLLRPYKAEYLKEAQIYDLRCRSRICMEVRRCSTSWMRRKNIGTPN